MKSVDIKSKSGKLLKYSATRQQRKSHFESRTGDSESCVAFYSAIAMRHRREIRSRCCSDGDAWDRLTAHRPSHVNFRMRSDLSVPHCALRGNALVGLPFLMCCLYPFRAS